MKQKLEAIIDRIVPHLWIVDLCLLAWAIYVAPQSPRAACALAVLAAFGLGRAEANRFWRKIVDAQKSIAERLIASRREALDVVEDLHQDRLELATVLTTSNRADWLRAWVEAKGWGRPITEQDDGDQPEEAA